MPLISRDRVSKTIQHQEPEDRFPRGELRVDEGFLNRLYPKMSHASWREKMIRLAGDADLDIVTIHYDADKEDRTLAEIQWWAAGTDFFVLVLLDGLFWHPGDPLSFEDYLMEMHGRREYFRSAIQLKKERALAQIKRSLHAGAHGCIVGDDIAFNQGPFISPDDLERMIFPGLRELAQYIKGNDRTAMFHSCGNVTRLVDDIILLGFDLFHGLSPAAGNDVKGTLCKTKGKMVLMGGIDLEGRTPKEIEASRAEMLSWTDHKRGYILGSSAELSWQTRIENVRTLYEF